MLCSRWLGAQDPKDRKSGKGAERPMYRDVLLAALRAAVLLGPEAREEFVGAVLSGDVSAAVAMLEPSRATRRIPYQGLSFYRMLQERDVMDVMAGSAIVKIRGVDSDRVGAAAAELKSNRFLGSVVMCAVHVAVSESQESPLPCLMATRLFHTFVSHNPDVLAAKEHRAFRPPQLGDDFWFAVFQSDNRHYSSGNALAKSVNHYVKCLRGEAFPSTELAPFKFLYRLGMPGETKGIDLAEVFTMFKKKDKGLPGVAEAWARVVADCLADRLSKLGITVRDGCIIPPDNQGFYFLFSWSEPVFKVARQVAARVSEGVMLETHIPAPMRAAPMRGVYWERVEWEEGKGERAGPPVAHSDPACPLILATGAPPVFAYVPPATPMCAECKRGKK